MDKLAPSFFLAAEKAFQKFLGETNISSYFWREGVNQGCRHIVSSTPKKWVKICYWMVIISLAYL